MYLIKKLLISKWHSLDPLNYAKNYQRWNIVSFSSSRQQFLSNDVRKFCQKWLVEGSKFVWKKKPSPSTNNQLLSLRKSKQ